MMNTNKVGLTLGSLVGLVHLIWAVMVKLGFGQGFLNWALKLHFISSPMAVTPFTIGNAIFLVILAFVGGYVLGWLFAAFYNYYDKKCK
ncbi:hypothetical protein KY310_02490 [Candidatus Woesearchaeota archaeon]|nr:hypothetical protein [Candidatus Woesearchaeota archaeon]